MAVSVNRVILAGNITRDIELRRFSTGSVVCDIGLAVNDRRKNQHGELINETTFVDITLWGKDAEFAGEYLSKGSPVLVEGRLKLDTWEKDGQKFSKLKVIGDRIHSLGTRSSAGGGGGGRSYSGSGNQSYQSSGNSGGGGGYANDSYGDFDGGGGNSSGGGSDEVPF